jgi:hypothetical protein
VKDVEKRDMGMTYMVEDMEKMRRRRISTVEEIDSGGYGEAGYEKEGDGGGYGEKGNGGGYVEERDSGGYGKEGDDKCRRTWRRRIVNWSSKEKEVEGTEGVISFLRYCGG